MAVEDARKRHVKEEKENLVEKVVKRNTKKDALKKRHVKEEKIEYFITIIIR